MSAGEFQLIDRHLTGLGAARADVVLGVGDDAALLDPAGTRRLAIASASAAAHDHEDAAALARDLFRLAAAQLDQCPAAPAWATLALTMAGPDEHWLEQFAQALHGELERAGVALVGGDTTAGPTEATLFLVAPMPA